jgi:hypothetical protein
MYNYFFTANGKFIKNNNIIESFTNNFSVSNDQICIDDTCLTKSEITLIKNQISENDLDKIINEKDFLSNKDVIIYIKDILNQIKNSNDNQYKYNLFNKYLCYGILDDRTNTTFKLDKYYINLDYNKFYENMDNRAIYPVNFSENEVLDIITNNRVDDVNDARKKYVVINKNLIGVNNNYYYFINEGYVFFLVKLKTDEENRWKIIITSDELIDKISVEIDQEFSLMFKINFDNIVLFNQKSELLKEDLINLMNNYKAISLLNGKYDHNIFRLNMCINYYDKEINLENYDDNYFNENIINSNVFEKKTFPSDKIIDLKLRMNVEDINLDYYQLNNDLFIYLIRKLDKDGIDYNWKILILENSI